MVSLLPPVVRSIKEQGLSPKAQCVPSEKKKTKVSQDDISLLGIEEAPATAVPVVCTWLSRDVLPFQEEKRQRLATVPPLTS